MAAPEWDALKAQWAITKPVMLAAASAIDKQAINPAEVATLADDLSTVTSMLGGVIAAHTPAAPAPAAEPPTATKPVV